MRSLTNSGAPTMVCSTDKFAATYVVAPNLGPPDCKVADFTDIRSAINASRRALNLKEQERAMTNDEPPPPTVTELQPESVALCPGEHVEFKASTSPPTERVKW